MTTIIEFFVPGTPRPQGSKNAIPRRGKNGNLYVNLVESSKHLKPWRKKVTKHAQAAWFGKPLDVAHGMELTFIMPRPKSHFRTGKFSGEMKPNAPIWHTGLPDRDKLFRAVGDALTGIAYTDDSRHCAGDIRKIYGCTPGVLIRIFSLESATP